MTNQKYLISKSQVFLLFHLNQLHQDSKINLEFVQCFLLEELDNNKDKEEYMARAPELIKQLRTEGEEQNG